MKDRFPAVTALLEQAVRNRVFAGCTFAILATGDAPMANLYDVQAWSVGQFTYDADSPRVRPDTVFDLASLTKVLATTAAVMLLYDRQQLALDTPLSGLLPQFSQGGSHDEDRRSRITVRMLLDHSSGLPGYARLFESANDRLAMIDACLHLPLTADPGTRAEYSDVGFMLLGHLVETITGEPLDGFCQREIFAPLGMTSTGFCPAPEMRPSIPPTEDDRDFRHRIIQGEVHDENAFVMDGVSGHAGLFSNALDPLRFAACILAEGVTATREKLFTPRTTALFAARAQQPPGTSRALGWDTPFVPSSAGSLFSTHSIGHLGFTGTSLWIDLDAGIAVCLLTNRTWPDRSNQSIRELRPRFHDAVRRAIANDQEI